MRTTIQIQRIGTSPIYYYLCVCVQNQLHSTVSASNHIITYEQYEKLRQGREEKYAEGSTYVVTIV